MKKRFLATAVALVVMVATLAVVAPTSVSAGALTYTSGRTKAEISKIETNMYLNTNPKVLPSEVQLNKLKDGNVFYAYNDAEGYKKCGNDSEVLQFSYGQNNGTFNPSSDGEDAYFLLSFDGNPTVGNVFIANVENAFNTYITNVNIYVKKTDSNGFFQVNTHIEAIADTWAYNKDLDVYFAAQTNVEQIKIEIVCEDNGGHKDFHISEIAAYEHSTGISASLAGQTVKYSSDENTFIGTSDFLFITALDDYNLAKDEYIEAEWTVIKANPLDGESNVKATGATEITVCFKEISLTTSDGQIAYSAASSEFGKDGGSVACLLIKGVKPDKDGKYNVTVEFKIKSRE